MNKISAFLTTLFIAAFRHIGSVVISVILIIVGLIWSDICLYIGLFLLISNVILVFINAIRMQHMMNYRSDDDPEFNEMMDRLSADPRAFLSEIIGTREENKQLHGEELLLLSDEDLFETVYAQNLDIAEGVENEAQELEALGGARKTVYILSLFDAEIQNGGLCQFFVNSSREVAPFVSECLKLVDADEHRRLFDDFVAANDIDVSNLESFKVFSKRGYIKQTKRFDFDSFDNSYYELSALQEKIVHYIRSHINEF